MKRNPTDIDLKYERFLKSKKYQNLTDLMGDYYEMYGTGEVDSEWEQLQGEYQLRLEAELAGAIPTEQTVHVAYQKELARCRN